MMEGSTHIYLHIYSARIPLAFSSIKHYHELSVFSPLIRTFGWRKYSFQNTTTPLVAPPGVPIRLRGQADLRNPPRPELDQLKSPLLPVRLPAYKKKDIRTDDLVRWPSNYQRPTCETPSSERERTSAAMDTSRAAPDSATPTLLSDIENTQNLSKRSDNHTEEPSRGGNSAALEQDLSEVKEMFVSANKGALG